MENILHRIHQAATPRNIWLSLTVLLVFALGIMPLAQTEIERNAPHGSIPDLHFSYSPTQLYDIFDGLGPAGRRMYALAEITADVFYPFAMAIFWALLFARLQRRSPDPAWLPLLPFATLLFDFLENAALLALLQRYPSEMNGLAQFASACTTLKWCSAGATMLTALTLSIGWFAWEKARLANP